MGHEDCNAFICYGHIIPSKAIPKCVEMARIIDEMNDNQTNWRSQFDTGIRPTDEEDEEDEEDEKRLENDISDADSGYDSECPNCDEYIAKRASQYLLESGFPEFQVVRHEPIYESDRSLFILRFKKKDYEPNNDDGYIIDMEKLGRILAKCCRRKERFSAAYKLLVVTDKDAKPKMLVLRSV
jgi:hypothetical protein